ncbi:MAG: two-component system sensor histidine kinase NtrB [Terriglobia bacterium]
MNTGDQLQQWLTWIIKIRFVIITFVFAIELAVRQFLERPAPHGPVKSFVEVIVLWYVLGLFYLIYNQLSRDLALQAYVQICGDIVLITLVVHVTGNLESNYISLYFLAVIMASIVLPRSRAFLVAAVCFVFMGSMLELAYLPNLYPAASKRHPEVARFVAPATRPADLETFEFKVLASLFGFFAVAYLSNHLAESLRRTGKELSLKADEVASLQALNENIIRSMRGGLITTDLGGNILVVNPAGGKILGRAPDELRGLPIHTVFQQAAQAEASFPPSLPPIARRESRYRCPNGEERVIGVSEAPLQVAEQDVVGYIYTFQDLTEEKQREAEGQMKERMATLGRMAAGIAHEIRNPLSSICGSVKLLESIVSLDEDQAKLMGIASRESARLDKLVSEFLEYARDQRFEFRPADLVSLLDETLLLLEHNPQFGATHRVCRAFPGRPVTIRVDTDKIRQVFWNICSNSLKAMPKGGSLKAEIRDAHPLKVSVVLSDTGVGMTAAQLERVFEPFHSRFSDGTGLGLAISYQIVKAHHGDIQVTSRPGEGARFLIDFPRGAEQSVKTLGQG